MAGSQPDPPTVGSNRPNGSGPESPQDTEPLADVQAIIDEIRASASRLLGDLSSLALAQWRLMSYVMTGSLSVLATRLKLSVMIGALVIAGWVFLNMALWHFVVAMTPYAPAPPLALLALNIGAAAILHLLRKGVRVK